MKLKLILTTAIVGVALALPSVSNAALPSVAGAKSIKPTILLEENCYMDAQGAQVYAVLVGVTGFPPNVEVTGTLRNSLGFQIGGIFTTDENGEIPLFGIGEAFVAGVTWTLTVESPFLGGTVTKTITVTCEPKPTSKAQCKNGGWRGFPQFKNQGQCIAFVNHRP
jgi:hypothetical protein